MKHHKALTKGFAKQETQKFINWLYVDGQRKQAAWVSLNYAVVIV